jgi:hypothetical protein
LCCPLRREVARHLAAIFRVAVTRLPTSGFELWNELESLDDEYRDALAAGLANGSLGTDSAELTPRWSAESHGTALTRGSAE